MQCSASLFALFVQPLATSLFGASLGTYGPAQIPFVLINYSYDSHLIFRLSRLNAASWSFPNYPVTF